jgi:hypothetical protein
MTPSWVKRVGLGRLLYRIWHQPRAAVARCVAEGGPLEQWRTVRGRHAMEAAARTLPALALGGAPLEVHLLTGRRFWYQSAFCLWSLAQHAEATLAPVIYDDGTLAEEHRAALARLFPAARFVPQSETIARLERWLPTGRFPVLRDRWLHYPNIRKLTEPHLGSSGWKFVLDSDLLFFRRPAFLLDWLDAPARPLHAVDAETSYGYSRALLNQLAGAPVADLVNVGLCGLRSDALDWEKIEHWCRTLIEREGTSYYLEQALVAMLVAGRPCAIAPAVDYVTLPQPTEANECRAVMHHYVAGSKRWYFRQNWRCVLTSATHDSRPGSPAPA